MKKIGILKETSSLESRVALNNIAVSALKQKGYIVYVSNNAGLDSGITNAMYEDSGAIILENNEKIIKESDILMKVLAPTLEETEHLKEGQIIFSFLNLITNPKLAAVLSQKKVTAIGYESIEDNNRYPILETMSKLVGKLCFQIGSYLLSMPKNGKGVLLGGSASASRSKVVIFGGGNAGKEFMKLANNAGSRITVFDIEHSVIQDINDKNPQIQTMYPFHDLIIKEIKNADLILGATFQPNAKTKKILSAEMIKMMEQKSVLIDLTAERGGISETTKLTSLKSEIYQRHNVYHYCVPNIAATIQKTATSALSPIILTYLLRLLITSENDMFDSVLENAKQINNGTIHNSIKVDNESKTESFYNTQLKKLNGEYDDIIDDELLNLLDLDDENDVPKENDFDDNNDESDDDELIRELIEEDDDSNIFDNFNFSDENFFK